AIDRSTSAEFEDIDAACEGHGVAGRPCRAVDRAGTERASRASSQGAGVNDNKIGAGDGASACTAVAATGRIAAGAARATRNGAGVGGRKSRTKDAVAAGTAIASIASVSVAANTT